MFRKMTSKTTGPAKLKSPAEEAPLAASEQELRREVEEKVRKLAELKRHRRGIDASIEKINGEISALFDHAEANALQLSIGLLKRVRRPDGEGWEFVIEV